MWFEEWGKKFVWREEDVYIIRKKFETIGANNLKNKLHRARSSNIRPNWIGEEVWKDLKIIWGDEKFKKESDRNKKNRASEFGNEGGFPLHMGGCVSFGEHARRSKEELGREPSYGDTFMKVHSKINEMGERMWVNDWARMTHETYTQKMSEISSQNSNVGDNQNEVESRQNELKVWTEVVGGPKKGRVRGLGGQVIFSSRREHSISTTSQPLSLQSEQIEVLDRVNQENVSLKKKVKDCEDMIANLQSQFTTFQQLMAPPHYPGMLPHYPPPNISAPSGWIPASNSSNPMHLMPTYGTSINVPPSNPSPRNNETEQSRQEVDDSDE